MKQVFQILITLLFLFPIQASFDCKAEIVEKKVEYTAGQDKLVGLFYSSDEPSAASPAIILFSDWSGLGEFSKTQARKIAKRGYRVFLADIYGGGKFTKDPKEAMQLSKQFELDRPLTRERAKAAFYALQKQKGVNSPQIAAIGFSFGGMVALELARSGVPLAATVTFHAPLSTPNASMAKNITGKVLALHGANDPFVTEAEVATFKEEMRDAKVIWELISYGGAFHAFTNPAVGTDPFSGAAYDERATRRAFSAMYSFLNETFLPQQPS